MSSDQASLGKLGLVFIGLRVQGGPVFGDEDVVECGEVRRDGVVRTVVMYKSYVVKHYQAKHTAWLLDHSDRTAS